MTGICLSTFIFMLNSPLDGLNFQDSDIFDITEKCNNIFQSYKVSEYLEAITRNQAISTSWYQHRMGRVTGTIAHDVLTRRDTTIPDNLVKRIVGSILTLGYKHLQLNLCIISVFMFEMKA
jgi:hypothetical protein